MEGAQVLMVDLSPLLLPILAYAETHYKFRYFLSWLRKKEPEIIVDAPRFIEPGKSIPILVLVKDAHLYPVELQRISLTIRRGDTPPVERMVFDSIVRITQRLWWRVFDVDRADWTEWVDIVPKIEYRCNGSIKRCSVDNYKGSAIPGVLLGIVSYTKMAN